MNVDATCNPSATVDCQPPAATLVKLHLAHLRRPVPFENLEILLRRARVRAVPSLFDRSVHRRRRGFC
ncbi:MAG: hypothetical protein DIU71_14820 [Proteobacteria bacterium]|nr:MAG: hypothetical protein DIU71_14820 [Pseudomonadota bacterium]